MSESEKLRIVEPRIQDIAVGATGLMTVPESVVADFCSGCDKQSAEDGICTVVGERDQGRYTLRQWCGWAAVDGARGNMTSEGFVPYKAE